MNASLSKRGELIESRVEPNAFSVWNISAAWGDSVYAVEFSRTCAPFFLIESLLVRRRRLHDKPREIATEHGMPLDLFERHAERDEERGHSEIIVVCDLELIAAFRPIEHVTVRFRNCDTQRQTLRWWPFRRAANELR